MNCGIKHSRGWKQLQPFAAALLLAAFGNTAFAGEAKPPIILDSTGGFEVGGKVITKVEAAWNEGWVGGEQVRNIRFEGDRLYIESPPMPHPNIADKSVRVIVVWQREKE